MTRRACEVCIIGPLPPPYAGATVSFQRFHQYLRKERGRAFRHFQLPIPAGDVNHWRTLAGVLGVWTRLRRCRSVVIFGSRNFCFSYGLATLLVAKLLGKWVCVRFFGGHPIFAVRRLPGVLRRLLLAGMGLADRLIIQTEVGRHEMPEHMWPRIVVIPGYRPMVPAAARREAGDGVVRFVFAGYVTAGKGIDVLLDAFARAFGQKGQPRAELHVFGLAEPEYERRLADADNVVYHGVAPNEELLGALPQYDAFVFPSLLASEGHPGAIVEALMAGLPVISTDLSGPSEIVRDGENGLVVPVGDAEALAGAMRRLAEDAELRRRLAKRARRSGERFDERKVLPRLAAACGLGDSDLLYAEVEPPGDRRSDPTPAHAGETAQKR